MLGDLAAALRAIVSQRLLRTHTGGRVPAVEVMLNTALIADLIQKADFSGVREAMEKSLAVGSQSFEQDLARLVRDGIVSRNEGLAHADSPNNLLWRLQNDFNASKSNLDAKPSDEDQGDNATFTEFTLDVKF
jgi:twitching motility protein PilU